ncbi:MAG TPA: alpha/beta hydrolase [Albitalea sp.]|nr:alpha/beta hydrolase [Albitalea sp.]
MTPASRFVDIAWRGAPLRIEYRWVGPGPAQAPTLVFLHEGLGSTAMWKDFPQRLCEHAGVRGLVFSRYGYGQSTPRPPEERWPVEFMHQQAFEVLPVLFDALQVRRPWLFGHSDGGSIALLHASRFAVAGVIAVAAHIFTEEFGLASIAAARTAYETTDLRARLARYHADVDSAFRGWNEVWLDPAFRAWNIEAELDTITCPLLVVQGEDDEYGTLAQVHGIVRHVPHAQALVLPRCGHSPHRDQPDRLIESVSAFVRAGGAGKAI